MFIPDLVAVFPSKPDLKTKCLNFIDYLYIYIYIIDQDLNRKKKP